MATRGFGGVQSTPPGFASFRFVELGGGRLGARCGLCTWAVEGAEDEIDDATKVHVSERHPDAWVPDLEGKPNDDTE